MKCFATNELYVNEFLSLYEQDTNDTQFTSTERNEHTNHKYYFVYLLLRNNKRKP